MGLMITGTAPIDLTMCGIPITGTLAKGVRTGDDTPFLGLVRWNHPTEMSPLIFFLGPNFDAQRVLTRAQNRGGFDFTQDESWIGLFVTPLALETAFRLLGLVVLPRARQSPPLHWNEGLRLIRGTRRCS